MARRQGVPGLSGSGWHRATQRASTSQVNALGQEVAAHGFPQAPAERGDDAVAQAAKSATRATRAGFMRPR
jgi:hypothetical protein